MNQLEKRVSDAMEKLGLDHTDFKLRPMTVTKTKIHTISAKGKDPTGFDEAVNDYLRAGWLLHGEPYIGSYAQNVMRHGHQEIQVEHVLVQVMKMDYDEDDDEV
jgi:hypothetical protein